MKNESIEEKPLFEFIKCEVKFFVLLILWLLIINVIAFFLRNTFPTAFGASLLLSVIVLILCGIYFIYQFIKVVLFNKEYECKNIYHRVSSWISSIVS